MKTQTETRVDGDHKVGGAASPNGSGDLRDEGAAFANESWRQIKNLTEISENKELKTALEDWKEIKNGCETRLKGLRKDQADLRHQVYNIIGFFSVFEGVVLTAVSQLTTGTSQPKCGKIWCPIVLTVIAAAVAITSLLEKHKRFVELEFLEAEAETLRDVTGGRIGQLRYLGKNFDFAKYSAEVPSDDQGPNSNHSPALNVGRVGVIVSVIVFTGVFVVSHFVILCDKWVLQGWD